MPKWLHNEIAKAASKKGLKGKDYDSYVYGTMNKIIKEAGGEAALNRKHASKRRGVAKP